MPQRSTSENSSRELMLAFCEDGNPDAFRTLVARFLPLVLGAALRRSGGDHALAEDIAQLVFSDFAKRMPKLRADDRIGTWLYRAAFLKAGDVMKSERRRKHREQLAATMQEIDRLPDPEGWRALAPSLDEAMQTLNERDREAIVLRYFEGKKIESVGQAIGVKTAAAQKRVERALDRLRTKLNRAGVAGSASVLAGLIASQSTAEASPLLVGHIANEATAGAAGATTGAALSSLISLPVVVLGALIALGVGSLPLLGERSTKQLAGAGREHKATPSKKSPGLGSVTALPKRGATDLEQIIAALGQLFSRPLTSLDRIRVDELLQRIPEDQGGRALALIDQHWTPAMIGRIDDADRRTKLFTDWSKKQPKAALEWLLEMLRPGSGGIFKQPQLWSMAWRQAFGRWGFSHSKEAWAWTQMQFDAGGFETNPQANLTLVLGQIFGPGLIDQLGKHEGIEALITLQELTAKPNYSVAMAQVLHHFETNEEFQSLLKLLEQRIRQPKQRVAATARTLSAWATRDWRAAIDWVAKLESEHRRSRYAWTIGFPKERESFDVGEHFRWLEEIAPRPTSSTRSHCYGPIMDGWFAREPGPAAEWLLSHPEWLNATVAYRVLEQLNTFATDPGKDEPEGWREHALSLVRDVAKRTERDPQTFTQTSIGGAFANDQETRNRMRQFLNEVAEEEQP